MADLTLLSRGAARPRATEFFGGIGLARLGLEAAGFDVVWTNDVDPVKQALYAAHFGADAAHEFVLRDIAMLTGADLPPATSLSWASSPCTDVSLAGARAGLAGEHSGTFWQWTRVLDEMGDERPPVVALENVVGLATSRGGDDLVAAITELNRLGYSADVLAIDARRFVPQSRPRLFVVGALEPPNDDAVRVDDVRPEWLQFVFDDVSLRTHRADLPPLPPPRSSGLSAMVEPPDEVDWWDEERTARFVTSLSSVQAARLEQLRRSTEVAHRTAYRRTRRGVPVWEIRPDDIAGCLRTARGGSSRQAVVAAGRGHVRARWMTPREYARLMGAGGYNLTGVRPNQARFGFGDAVCVPVVAWLAETYLLPLVRGSLRELSGPHQALA